MRSTTFQELVDTGILEIGDGYRARNDELGGNGPIFLRAGHVDDYGSINFAGVERFRAELDDRVRPKTSAPGDTVVTTKGNSTGRTTFVRPEMPQFVYSPHLSYWRSLNRSELDPDFVRFWSRGPAFRSQLQAMQHSTDMAPYLSLTDQRRLRIDLPSLDEQRAIASVLGALDEKVELNRQMNRTLEALATAFFTSWFIDFDPVVAKGEGRAPFGMSTETAALFPATFEESALGPIPQGWLARALPEAVAINPARTLPSGTLAPYLDMANMPTDGHAPVSWALRAAGSGMRFKNGDTLVARITPCLENGKTAFVDFLDENQVGWDQQSTSSCIRANHFPSLSRTASPGRMTSEHSQSRR